MVLDHNGITRVMCIGLDHNDIMSKLCIELDLRHHRSKLCIGLDHNGITGFIWVLSRIMTSQE